MPTKPEQDRQQPGADRFWGEFSQSKAGRSNPGAEADAGGSGPEPAAGATDDSHCLEWCPICRSAELFRTTLSPELRQQSESIQHEAMGVLKAFLDAYADRSADQTPGGAGSPADGSDPTTGPDPRPGEDQPRVTDIPLD